MNRLSLFVLLSAAILLVACHEIDKTGLEAESVPVGRITNVTQSVNVSQSEAAGIAEMFLRTEAGSNMIQTKSSGAQSKRVSTTATVREDGQDMMYVFNYEDGGFVIVGSTRNYYPILAYSDKGSFELQDDMGPVDVWLDETKVCIKNSSSLSAETKAEMQQLWARYDGTYQEPSYSELAARRPQTRSTGEDYCWERCEELDELYGDEGWTFLPLSYAEDLFIDAGLSNTYDNICYSATQNHSALNETVIGYKDAPIYHQEGPLLASNWHQGTPYNDLCQDHCPAGCATIAIAQVMRFYSFPDPPGNLSWNNIPPSFNLWNPTYQHPQLIMRVRQYLGLSGTQTTAYFGDIKNALDSIGFIVSPENHNYISVKNELFNEHKPIIMVGCTINIPSLPWQLISGHCWVCDGAQENIYDQITYFTENQPYGAGTFEQGMYSHSYPGIVGGIVYLYFHMNWGGSSASDNTWYVFNSFTNAPNGDNYQYFRKDFYVSVPNQNQ